MYVSLLSFQHFNCNKLNLFVLLFNFIANCNTILKIMCSLNIPRNNNNILQLSLLEFKYFTANCESNHKSNRNYEALYSEKSIFQQRI